MCPLQYVKMASYSKCHKLLSLSEGSSNFGKVLGLQCLFLKTSFIRDHISRSLSSQRVSKSLSLEGIYPPIPTPFHENEMVAYDRLESNFEKWNLRPFKGYLVEGSNGEYLYLNSEERIELIKKAKSLVGNGKLLLVGSGCECAGNPVIGLAEAAYLQVFSATKETIYMTNKMAEVGADAAMIVTPSYYKSGMNDKALFHHYETIATMSLIPIILYNVPSYTGLELNTRVICSLAKHDNIIGLKESGGDVSKIGDIIYQTKDDDFQVLAGSAGFLLASLQLGCVGGVCALANVLGSEVCKLYQLFMEGNMDEAVELQKKLISPNAAVTKVFGIPGLKAMMDTKGYYGGRPRQPLQKLSADDLKKLNTMFTDTGYL